MVSKNFDSYQSEGFYPRILIPSLFTDIENLAFTFRDINPSFNIPTAPKMKIINNESENIVTFFGCSFLGLLLLFFLLMFSFVTFDYEKQFWAAGGRTILITGAVAIGSIATILNYRSNRKLNHLHEINFNHEMKKYEQEKNEFLRLKAKSESPAFIREYRLARLRSKLLESKEQTLKSCQILSDKEIKKGPTEELFYELIKRYTTYQVYKSLKFGYYFPDIVLIDDNILMDIEIDEPYIFETKEPIHYDSIDFQRDKYFMQNNFVVVRFSEDQILSDPLTCIDIIKEVFDNCKQLKSAGLSEKYLNFRTKSWTHETAFNFAYNDSRKHVRESIDNVRTKYLC